MEGASAVPSFLQIGAAWGNSRCTAPTAKGGTMERMILRLPYTPQTDRREVIPSLLCPTAFAACVQLLTDSRARTNTLSDLVASASRTCLARNCDVGDATQ